MKALNTCTALNSPLRLGSLALSLSLGLSLSFALGALCPTPLQAQQQFHSTRDGVSQRQTPAPLPTRGPASARTPSATRSPNSHRAHYQAYLQNYLNQPGRIERDHSVVRFSGVEYFHRAPASVSTPQAEDSNGNGNSNGNP